MKLGALSACSRVAANRSGAIYLNMDLDHTHKTL
jgi:hypothetical protein